MSPLRHQAPPQEREQRRSNLSLADLVSAKGSLSRAFTVVTSASGSRTLHTKTGASVDLPDSGMQDEDGLWGILDPDSFTETTTSASVQLTSEPRLLALVSARPELARYLKLLHLGATNAAVIGRVRRNHGADAAHELREALGQDNAAPAEGEEEVRHGGTPAEQHGLLGSELGWAAPVVAARSSELARPGYDSVEAHEYLDTPEVLGEKVRLLASLLRKPAGPHILSYLLDTHWTSPLVGPHISNCRTPTQ